MFSVCLMTGRVSLVTPHLRALLKLSFHFEKRQSPQITLRPLAPSHSLTSPAHPLLLPLHTGLLVPNMLASQDFCSCCALYLEHSSPDKCIAQPGPPLKPGLRRSHSARPSRAPCFKLQQSTPPQP